MALSSFDVNGSRTMTTDIHELCIEGDFAELKSLLESSTAAADVNQYKLFVYRPVPSHSQDDHRFDDNDDDDYQADETCSDSATMFDYRSPLFYAILHDRLACVKLLVEHGANIQRLR